VIDDFSVSPTTIEQGQSVTASWSTSGGTTRVELLRENDVIWADTQLNNSLTDTPPQEAPYTIIYTLIAYNNAEQSETSEAIVEIVPAPPQNPLANTTWQLGSMEGAGDIPPEVSITAYFSADGSLTGNGGCNSYTTSYSADGQAITIQFPGTTEAMCGEPVDSLEKTYLELLPQAANFEINGDRLIIWGNGGQEILQYRLIG
jgi:heat shock protein HslJ